MERVSLARSPVSSRNPPSFLPVRERYWWYRRDRGVYSPFVLVAGISTGTPGKAATMLMRIRFPRGDDGPSGAGRALTVMTEIPADRDVAEIRHDIHGDSVVNPPQCDYCGLAVAIDQPVLYEVVRIADMPNLEQLFAPPTDWFADALRCHRCDVDAVSPATEGFDEALVRVTLAESNGVVSIDATSLTVVDYSPVDVGFYPPMVNLAVLAQTGDIGVARWVRVQGLFEHGDQTSPLVAAVREAVERSREMPLER